VNILNMCEGDGSGQMLPEDVLSQTSYYHNARTIVLGEKWRIHEIKEKARKRRK